MNVVVAPEFFKALISRTNYIFYSDKMNFCSSLCIIYLSWNVFFFLCASAAVFPDETIRENRLEKMAEKQQQEIHTVDSYNLLLYIALLCLTVLTVYVFRRREIRFFHESGMIMIYGQLILLTF